VSWLQKGQQILVSEQSKVEIQVGGYKDEILCDIMTMDVYHILLGRPWQYDRKVVHDGRRNTILTSTNISDLPAEIQMLLDELVDIVVDELPNALPPIRSIRHHIDLIPGASLPNKVA